MYVKLLKKLSVNNPSITKNFVSLNDYADFERGIVQIMFYSCFILSRITKQFEVCGWGSILMELFIDFDWLLHDLWIGKLTSFRKQQPF